MADVAVAMQVRKLPTFESQGANSNGMEHFASASHLLAGFHDGDTKAHHGKVPTPGSEVATAPVVEARLRGKPTVNDATAVKPTPAEKPLVEIENGNDTGKASKQFQDRMQKAFNNLPEDIKRFAAKYGVHIAVAPMADSNHPEAPGEYVPNTVYISEKNLKDQPDALLNTVLRHEIAHSYDNLTQRSFNRDFRNAVQDDFEKMKKEFPEDYKKLDDEYKTVRPDGKLDNQAFKEIFAQLVARATGPASEDSVVNRLFPTSYRWIKENIKF